MVKTSKSFTSRIAAFAIAAVLLIGTVAGVLPSFAVSAEDSGASTPTFTLIDGKSNGQEQQDYEAMYDGNIGTKYCIAITNTPYIVLGASGVDTVVTGYKLYTADDTAAHAGRNPKAWTLFGSNDMGEWKAIHTVTDDTTLGAANKTPYSFTFENTTAYLFYKLEFTARHGTDGEDGNLMQLSEVEFTAVSNGTVTVNTEADLISVFANGGKARLNRDVELIADLTLREKTVELDLNGYVLGGKKVNIWSAAKDASTVLVLSDSRPDATHTDATLPKGGVVKSQIFFNKDGDNINNGILYANGGSVKDVFFNTAYGTVSSFGNKMTSFLNDVGGYGGNIAGGIYYGEFRTVQNSSNTFKFNGKKLTFKDGDDVYAYEVVNSYASAIKIADPEKSNYTFIGWRNTSVGGKYDFSGKIAADLTLSAMWSTNVANLTELKAAIANGYSVKLMADIELEASLLIAQNGNCVTLDLNGYVLGGDKGVSIKGSMPATQVTIIDSRPTSEHKNAAWPKGGYLHNKISTDSNQTNMYINIYANGGTIKEVHAVSKATKILSTSATPSVIKGKGGTNYITLSGGLYYYNEPLLEHSKKITFKNDGKVYAVGATDAETLSEPIAPTKTGYVFYGWYNGETKYDFSSALTSALTLDAKWVEDSVKPVISGADTDKFYCTAREMTVTEQHLDKVTVNGTAVQVTADGKFTLDMSTGGDKTVVAIDKAGNSSEMTVKYGHTMGTWINEVPASCTDGMLAHKDCTVCGKHFDADDNEKTDDELKITKLGHQLGALIAEVPATCTEDGTKAHKDCSVCGKHFDTNGDEITDLTIPAAHKLGNLIDEVPATTEKEGVKAHKDCTECGKHFDADGNELDALAIEKLQPTETDAQTKADGNKANTDSDTEESEGGCKSTVTGFGAFAIMLTLAVACLMKKRTAERTDKR